MEEIKNEVVETTPKYILQTPKAPDIFTLANIISKIGVNKFYDYYTSQPLYNIGQIDKIMVDLATQSNSSYSPVNYLTVYILHCRILT